MKQYDNKAIKTIQGLEHMRARAGMWGFQLNSIEGNLIQIKEIVDNSIDEALDPSKVYPIDITFFVAKNKATYQVLVRDHGRGIPPAKLLDCFTKEFTSGKYEAGSYVASVGTNGVGSKATAALSKEFYAFTKRNDGFGYLKLKQGQILDNKVSGKTDKNQDTVGTVVFFQPDDTLMVCTKDMFAKDNPDNGFSKHLERMELTSLLKGNVILNIRVVDGLMNKDFYSLDPWKMWKYLISDEYQMKTVLKTDPSISPRQYVSKKFNLKEVVWELGRLRKPITPDDPLGYDLDLFLDERSVKGYPGLVGAVNSTPITNPDSSHIEMFQTCIKNMIVDNIADTDAKAFFEDKYRLPLSGMISVRWQGAEFIGQDKTRFENRQFADLYRSNLRKEFKKITAERGEGVWDRLFELIKEHFEIEYARFAKRSLGLTKSMKNITYDLIRPESYNNCSSTNNQLTELFITEGDSAAGRVKTVRDDTTQALLKLSGKPINAIRSDRTKLDKNAIFSDLAKLIGVAPSDKNLDNMRFSKILIMTDADADGYHIVSLLVGIFYKINPLILEEGRIYVTNPPLFSLMDNKNKPVYLRDEAALRDVRISSYSILLDLDVAVWHKDNHGKMVLGDRINLNKKKAEFRDICLQAIYLGDIMTHYADLLNIDYLVLEQLLHVADCLDENHVNTKKIKEVLDLEQVTWDKVNNVIILVDRGMEWRISLSNLQKTIKAYLLPEYERAHWNDIELFVTTKYTDMYVGQPCTYMLLHKIFSKIDEVYNVRRFKGLGEMSAEAIKLTCVDKETRCFTPIRKVGDVERLFQMLSVDTSARKKLVDSGFVDD